MGRADGRWGAPPVSYPCWGPPRGEARRSRSSSSCSRRRSDGRRRVLRPALAPPELRRGEEVPPSARGAPWTVPSARPARGRRRRLLAPGLPPPAHTAAFPPCVTPAGGWDRPAPQGRWLQPAEPRSPSRASLSMRAVHCEPSQRLSWRRGLKPGRCRELGPGVGKSREILSHSLALPPRGCRLATRPPGPCQVR